LITDINFLLKIVGWACAHAEIIFADRVGTKTCPPCIIYFAM
jgi:hypothetical protein